MRPHRVRFRPGELEKLVLSKIVENPGLYGAKISDLIFEDPRGDGYFNRIAVLESIKILDRKGHVRRKDVMVPSPHGRRPAKLVYPTATGIARLEMV